MNFICESGGMHSVTLYDVVVVFAASNLQHPEVKPLVSYFQSLGEEEYLLWKDTTDDCFEALKAN